MCTVAIVQFGIKSLGTGAYGHETFECSRVWPMVYSEAPESVVVPYVVKTEGGELRERGC